MQLIDTHAHLDMKNYSADIDSVLERAEKSGVYRVINAGCDRLSSEQTIALCEKYEMVYGVIGFHPHDAVKVTKEDMQWLRDNLKHPKILAVGEAGLDFHYNYSPADVQKKIFEQQLEIAGECGKRMVVHSREAAEMTFDIIRASGVKTLLHCFSGSAQMAERYMADGHFLSFGGALTFKNARKTLDAATAGLDRIMLETDCPYMTPEPFRGKRNEPAYVIYTLEKLSQITGKSMENLAEHTLKNAKEFFQTEFANG